MNEKIVSFFSLRVEKGLIGNCPNSAQILLKNAEFLPALLNGRFQIIATSSPRSPKLVNCDEQLPLRSQLTIWIIAESLYVLKSIA